MRLRDLIEDQGLEGLEGVNKIPLIEDLPSRPLNASEGLRGKLRERAKTDLYFLCKTVLGYYKLNPKTHGPLCRFMDQARYNRRMILMPRSHYKTTIATIGDTIKRIINDPEIRILIVADTAANAERFMLEIGNHFKHNDYLQWLFPELIPENFNKTRWNQKEIIVRRKSPWKEPTVDSMGAGGGIESRHYEVIKADDLVTEKHIHSDTEMDKLIAWVGGMEPLLVSDVTGEIDYVGSRKKKGDLYEHLQRYYGDSATPRPIGPFAQLQGALALFSRSIFEDGKLIFPFDENKQAGVSMQYVLRMRTHDPERYHAQLANSPKGTGLNIFRVEDLRYFTLKEGHLIEAVHEGKLIEEVSVWNLTRIILFDPSVAEKKSSSQQAILVVAKGSSPFRYILETHIGHYQPDEAVSLLFELDKKWKPEFFSIEKRGFQGSIKYWLNEKAEREMLPYLPVVEYPAEGSPRAQWAKQEHIRGLQPLTRSHLIWLQEDQMELIDQFEFYPNVRWDDGLDGLAQGLEYWPLSMDDQEIGQAKEREARMLAASVGGFGSSAPWEREERKPFSEEDFLRQFDPTGYGLKGATYLH